MDATTPLILSTLAPTSGAPASLSTWQRGDEGVVTAIPGTSRLLARLRELGVVPGVKIRVLRTGTSLVIQVAEGRLCLRRQDAIPILVAATHPS
ncbi:MAG: ferrous iron transport protein A [Candidatus Latescibacteria bacterium]|nr:ferrous iron transport protein A [Candidatus Latescibacterota bacterium]